MVATLVADLKDPLGKWMFYDLQGEVLDEIEIPTDLAEKFS